MHVHCELVVLFLALTLNCPVHTGRIIGGHVVEPHSRPYMVLLEQLDSGKHCGGFILSEDFVMTAAHCKSKSYKVYLGLHSVNNKTDVQEISVEQRFPHKNYDPSSYRNDIMLLKLSSKVKFNNNVKSIELADQSGNSLPTSCRVPGWGIYKRNKKFLSPTLRELDVTLIENQNCKDSNCFCSEGPEGPAEGDSGGPLVCEDGKAYGVVSAVIEPKNGGPYLYLYTQIPEHTRWIDRTMANA